MKKKNLMIFHPIGKWIGGGETGLIDLIKHLNPEKFNIQVVLPHKGPLSDELSKLNIRHHFIHIRRWHSVETKFLLPYLLVRLSLVIGDFKPDLIFCNSHDVVPFGVIIKSILRKPVISFIGVELIKELAEKYLIQYSDAVIVKTNWQKREIEKIKKEGVYNLRDGFDIEKFAIKDKELIHSELKKELNIPSNGLLLLSVGRFEDVKNFEYSIIAVKQTNNKNVYLLIVGAKFDNSLYEQRIFKLIKELDFEENVRIIPFTKDLAKYFIGSHIFIQSSKSEGLPRTVIEAMLYGLPLILSDIEPHKEILCNGKGFLVPLDNSLSLTEKINFFYNNKDFIKEFGDYNRESAFKNYDIEVYIKKVEEIFKRLG